MGICDMDFEHIFRCEVVDACSLLNAVIPESKRSFVILHILSDSLLYQYYI